jgi:CBS domain-containing protein
MLTARDIMTENVVTILPSAPVREAIELLLSERISGLPVVDEEGRLAGIISEFALLAIAYDQKVMKESIAHHMTTEVLSVDANDSMRKVADQFIVHRVRRMPVLENGRVAGVISRCDVLQAVYRNDVLAAVYDGPGAVG